MGGIFVSYRSGPHSVIVGALEDRLRHYFGDDQVFVDHQMTPGTPYPDELRTRLLASDVVVAVIHDGWLAEFAKERPKDWVLFEIDTALRTPIPVIPVVLEDLDPPQRHDLPDEIAEIAVLQVARVRRATFRADINHLVHMLERYVAPATVPPPKPAAKRTPKRVVSRVAAWALALFLITPILLLPDPDDQLWEWFTFAAFGSTVILAGLSLSTMIFVPLVKRWTYRFDVQAGTMTLSEATKRRWLVLALAMLPFVYFLSKFGTKEDGAWQEWEVWYLIVVGIVALFLVHRSWRQSAARDHDWPPPVSTEPAVFRRAANRLYERLTTDPDWRGTRSRANQLEAESVYHDLMDVRQALRDRAAKSLPQWIKAGCSGEIVAYLGWLASILALEIVAAALAPVAIGPYRLIGVTVAAAVAFTAAKTVAEFYADRRDVARWIDELTTWQAKIDPLVFTTR
ncbi:toll/interleukin-1 receptor domain-containing protein [Kibdelosporangium persicum]|uniref:TIR domain-containing protein n=1 Tax=Kibdelosporangium persicum TaxID=2698649 RepID=A0ABX2FHC1_9PSEU|nr:toll/interleukin-1 receptor domain-containing protein [Kibdelosporangium persicum]NRN70791.1 TIR domain-containing protein [Kibdelosporangium persicum]